MPETEIVAEPGQHWLSVHRTFPAPPSVVYAAITDPALIPHWWGPAECGAAVDHMRVEPGGRWRIRNLDADGRAFAASEGVYHAVVPDERIVRTVEYSRMPERVQLQTETFDDLGGRTRYQCLAVCQTVADRDRWLSIDAERGLRATLTRLAAVISDRSGAPPQGR